MAVQKESNFDVDVHENTYRRFLTVVKWACISVAILMVVLYFVVQP